MRSPALAVLGIALMAGAAILGAVLVHDGEVAPAADLARAAPGQSVEVKGDPAPFVPSPTQARQWHLVTPLLGNHTYEMADPAGAAVALLTSATPAPHGTVLAQGEVRYVGPHPDGSGRLLVVVAVREWREPILFR